MFTKRTEWSTSDVHPSRALHRQQTKSSLTLVLKWQEQCLQLMKRGAMGGEWGKKEISLGYAACRAVPGTSRAFMYHVSVHATGIT